MAKKNKGNHRPWKKKVQYSLLSLAVLIGAGLGYGYYRYRQLQPANHFKNLKAIGSSNSANASASNATNSTVSQIKPSTNVPGTFNVFLIGTDAKPGQKLGHSDAMELIHVNLNTHQYHLLSFSYDTRVHYAPYGYTKIASVLYMNEVKHGVKQGIVDTVKYVSKLTGMPINYYADTNYWGLQDIINAIGGINMYVPYNVTINHAWYPKDNGKKISKGTHFLKGRMVTELVHVRNGLPGTDFGRQKLQEEALAGIAKALAKPKNIPRIPKVLASIHKYVVATNMNSSDIMSVLLGVRGTFKPSEIHYHQVKGPSKKMYNGMLQAYDDEVVLQPGQLKAAAKKYL